MAIDGGGGDELSSSSDGGLAMAIKSKASPSSKVGRSVIEIVKEKMVMVKGIGSSDD